MYLCIQLYNVIYDEKTVDQFPAVFSKSAKTNKKCRI